MAMTPENQTNPTAVEEKGAGRRIRGWKVSLTLLGAAVLLAAIYGSLRIISLEKDVARLSRQVEDSTKRVEEVGERSEEAMIRASQAEENALRAARGREQAEQARAEYERIAESAKQEAQQAREEADRVRQEREAELDRMQKALSEIAETRRTALGLVMNLGEDTLKFDFDKATLRPENRELLSRIAGVLLTSKGYRIDVFGHTDDIGTEEYNLKLSQRRAQSVRNYLVEAGVDAEIIATKGIGKSSPRVPGTTPAARAANRRVEIAIVDSVIEMLGPAGGRKK
jgi:outer membrane protein OmpA-like peptidoglycan-associated protein